MILFLWFVGLLFTWGFHRWDKKEEEMKGLIGLLLVALWPIALGHDLRNVLSR